MAEDLLSGRVTSFRREQGFGVITLDDGRDVKFDAHICKGVLEEGEAVQLRIAPARWGGGFKALHVEPRVSSTLVVSSTPSKLDEQIAMLQGEHLIGALSEHVMEQLVADAFGGQLGDATLIDVIDAFYVQDKSRARHDGYLRRVHGLRQDATEILTEIAALLPDAIIPRRMPEMPAGTAGAEAHSFDRIVAFVNDALRAAGDARRLYPMKTRDDWYACFALPSDRAQRLASVLPFTTPPDKLH